MGVLVIAVCAGAMLALYAIDRGVKARHRALRRREMSGRLAAAALRAEEQQARREAAAQASKALTSVIPAIKRPSLSSPGRQGRAAGPDRPGQGGHGSTGPGRRNSRTGPQQAVRRPENRPALQLPPAPNAPAQPVRRDGECGDAEGA
jgi:hypothetical protein